MYLLDVGAGVIDPDYTGPIWIVMFNHGDSPYKVHVGDRIAQLVLERYAHVDVREVAALPTTVRGSKGFGSTDKVMAKMEHLGVAADYGYLP